MDANTQIYLDYRKQLLTERAASFVQFDQAMLSLAGGALALSLAFIKDVVPLSRVACLPLLYVSWAMFLLSIVLTVISFITSWKAYDQQLALAEEYHVGGNEKAYSAKNTSSNITELLNYGSALFLILGFCMTAIFVGSNLSIVARLSA